MGAHYSGVVENTDGAIQGEANGMCDMRERVHIEQAADNRFEFVVDGSDKPYAFVSINGDVVQSGVCSDDAALRAAAGKLIKEAFHSIDKERVEEAEAKLRRIKKTGTVTCKLPRTVTYAHLARVMLATDDMVKHLAFLSKDELERWLMDSCTDTVLISRTYAKRHGLKIDTATRLRIGTAGGATFVTDGVVDFELMAKTLHGKMKPVKLMGARCGYRS